MAAIRCAGRALLRRSSPVSGGLRPRPAAAVGRERRRGLQSLLQQHCSSPRGLHSLLHHQPHAAAGAGLVARPAPVSMGAGGALRRLSSYDYTYYYDKDKCNTLLEIEEEERKAVTAKEAKERMKKKKMVELLTKERSVIYDQEEEMKNIDELLQLIDPNYANDDDRTAQVEEMRGELERKKNELLAELFNGTYYGTEEKKKEVVAAARQLRDAHAQAPNFNSVRKKLEGELETMRVKSTLGFWWLAVLSAATAQLLIAC